MESFSCKDVYYGVFFFFYGVIFKNSGKNLNYQELRAGQTRTTSVYIT